jgi:uncharacterized UPF0146 family protein
MQSYDIEWYLAFKGFVKMAFITDLTNRLGLSNKDIEIYKNADLTYKITRSLDIMMPIILTKCNGYSVRTYRDNLANKFVIKVSG